jgi:hypothetical protein
MYRTKELCSITAQYATSNETDEFCLPLGSKEVTPSSGTEAPSYVAVESTREDDEGRNRRCKQHN